MATHRKVMEITSLYAARKGRTQQEQARVKRASRLVGVS